MQKRVIQCKKVKKPDVLIGQYIRNSQIANQMQALDVATFGYAENLRAKQWLAF